MSSGHLQSPLKNSPSCWDDDKRMTALYSPFRMREANPVDYDSKMKFWQNIVFQWCLERNTSVFTVQKIQEEFKRKEKVPLGLSTVVTNLERDGLVKVKEDFLKIDPSETWTEWAIKSIVKTPVIWSFTKLKMALSEIDERRVEYICIEFLKKKGAELLSAVASNQKLYEQAEVKDLLKNVDGIEMSQESFDILIRWMQINKQIHLKRVENDVLIKFIDDKSSPISDIEVSIHVIEKNKLSFEKAICALEEEKDDLVIAAKSYLKKGMRETAKTYLRRKKEVEKAISKRVAALENIESMLARIHDTSNNSKVLETYKVALNALKSSFKEHGLSEDEVTKTVTEIQEINEMHEEIQNALSEPVSGSSEAELEDELMVILNNEKQKVSAEFVLPEVPSHTPEKIGSKSSKDLESTLS